VYPYSLLAVCAVADLRSEIRSALWQIAVASRSALCLVLICFP